MRRAPAGGGTALVSGSWLPPALLPLAAAIVISVAPPGISSAESAGLPTPEVLQRANEARANKAAYNSPANLPDYPPLPPTPAPPLRPTGMQTSDAIARKEAAAEL